MEDSKKKELFEAYALSLPSESLVMGCKAEIYFILMPPSIAARIADEIVVNVNDISSYSITRDGETISKQCKNDLIFSLWKEIVTALHEQLDSHNMEGTSIEVSRGPLQIKHKIPNIQIRFDLKYDEETPFSIVTDLYGDTSFLAKKLQFITATYSNLGKSLNNEEVIKNSDRLLSHNQKILIKPRKKED